MPQCPACLAEVPEHTASCPSCGAVIAARVVNGGNEALSATLSPVPYQSGSSPSRSAGGTKTPVDPGFAPGTVFADRYRIVTRLGAGGMGEVYRADDLKLGQTVALKFLARDLEANPRLLELFRSEVRLAREVTHPNVCRVHDIGEAEGRHFLTMERVDGEDLGSLLKRIGRLPGEKALQVARQLCAGLAAAHDKGVLHRDLKPANIMLDGRGTVRITDFGLALLAGEGGDEMAGTPAYMAPELFDGQKATVRSDIYALGLVLYEVFTGHRAFDGTTYLDMQRQQAESTPSTPSTLVPDLDPAVGRVIARCMEKDPALRPVSVAQVMAALPGGDPLAAALAAGETPSPELVAAAGAEGTLRPWVAVVLLAAIAVMLAAAALLWPLGSTQGLARLAMGPEALADRCRQIAQTFGYPVPSDRASWGETETDFIEYHLKAGPSTAQRRTLPESRPGTLTLHYRETPRSFRLSAFQTGVSDTQPPHTDPGMVDVRIDGQGRLMRFRAVPPVRVEPAAAVRSVDWSALFREAGLDPAAWQEVPPTLTPPVAADARREWIEAHPAAGAKPLRAAAAAFDGRVVWFTLTGPWEKPAGADRSEQSAGWLYGSVNIMIFVGLMGLGVYLVRRNLRAGRGDRRGALRVAAIIGISLLANWVLIARMPATLGGVTGWIFAGIAIAMGQAGFVWAVYLGIEPYVRRRWPNVLIGWSRLLAGGWRDPLVGRDVLTGTMLGLGIWLFNSVSAALPGWLDMTDSATSLLDSRVFPVSVAEGLGWLAGLPVLAMSNGVFIAGILFVLRLVLRRDWLAAVAFTLLVFVPQLFSGGELLLAPLGFAVVLLLAMSLVRWGLLTFAVCLLVNSLEPAAPVFAAVGCWVPWQGWLGTVVVAALAAYGFRVALGRQKLLPSLEE